MSFDSKINSKKIETDIKDIYLKTQIEKLLNNWYVQKIKNEILFYKHFKSNKKGLIYQLILSGNDYDGIYEFEIFGHNLSIKNVLKNNDVVMVVKSLSNCSLALFEKGGGKTILCSKQYLNNDFFKKDVIKRLYNYDAVSVSTTTNKNILINLNETGEIAERKIVAIFNNEEVRMVQFIEKKDQYTISYIDMGAKKFKKELIEKGYVTLEEYTLFTSKKADLYSQIYKDMRKIEML